MLLSVELNGILAIETICNTLFDIISNHLDVIFDRVSSFFPHSWICRAKEGIDWERKHLHFRDCVWYNYMLVVATVADPKRKMSDCNLSKTHLLGFDLWSHIWKTNKLI